MAKKQKRQVSRSAAVREQVMDAPEASAQSKAAPVASRSFQTSEFNPDYSYVRKDLKKIGILAVSFLSVLIVLSFFLQ